MYTFKKTCVTWVNNDMNDTNEVDCLTGPFVLACEFQVPKLITFILMYDNVANNEIQI